MSISVPLDELDRVVAQRAPDAFVVTAGDDGRVKVVHVVVEVGSDGWAIRPGRGTRANVERGAPVTVVFAPTGRDEMSLLVDGVGTAHDDHDVVIVRPTAAVWHRSAYGATT